MATFTRQQIAANPAWAEALGAAPKARKRPGGAAAMNGLEQRYNARLLTLVTAGEVLWFAFNDFRLRYGEGAYFKGDFFIQFATGALAVHETKGHEREAAMARIKAAALRYPHISFVLVKAEGDGFSYETIGAKA